MRLIWELSGILFVIIFGTLLHFMYQWTGKYSIAGLIAPVNESTWEHLKLLFYPMLLFTILEFMAFGKDESGFILAKAIGIVIGMFAIVIIFYSYTAIIKENFLWADILTFIIGVVLAFFSSRFIQERVQTDSILQMTGFSVILLLLLLFTVFTYNPPRTTIFKDPVTGTYGLAHS